MIDAILNIFTDAISVGKVSDWFQSLFSYRKNYKNAVEISFDEFISMLSNKPELLNEVQERISNSMAIALLIDTCDTEDKYVNGQIMGLNKKFRCEFIVKSPLLNTIFSPKQLCGSSFKVNL